MGRRNFIFRSVILVVAFVTGCDWVKEVESIIPAALKALSLLLSMIKDAGIVVGTAVETVIGDINTAAGDVLAALQSGPLTGTVLQKVITALNDFLTYFQNFITLLPPLPAAIIDLVGMGIEIILSTIEGYLMNPPTPVPVAATQSHADALKKIDSFRGRKINGMGGKDHVIQFVAQERKPKQFRNDWNAVEPTQYRL